MQFIANKQQDSQDGISWREELHNLADDAAIEDMETADLLCVVYVTGIKNDELREKLLEINNPTIAKFDRVVDSSNKGRDAKHIVIQSLSRNMALHAMCQGTMLA